MKSLVDGYSTGYGEEDVLPLAREILSYLSPKHPHLIIGDGFEGDVAKKILELDGNARVYESGADAEVVIDGSGSRVFDISVPESAMKVTLSSSSSLAHSDLTFAFFHLLGKYYDPKGRGKYGKIVLLGEKDDVESHVHLLEDEDLKKVVFPSTAYKNVRGHMALFGGSENFTGAVKMAGEAAFHAGAGLVSVFTGEKSFLPISLFSPFIMQRNFGKNMKYDSYIIGPGWGNEGFRDYLFIEGRKVIDADAIKLIRRGDKFKYSAVLTPHIGEFEKILENLGMEGAKPEDIATELECVIVLKASTVTITNGVEKYIYDGVNPSLGVAGSGDVLSGIIGFYLAHQDVLDAALNGVIHHQIAGKFASGKFGYYDAFDLIDQVGKV